MRHESNSPHMNSGRMLHFVVCLDYIYFPFASHEGQVKTIQSYNKSRPSHNASLSKLFSCTPHREPYSFSRSQPRHYT